MDNLTATAMNGLAMDSSAMDCAMARQWTALQQRNGNGCRDGNRTLMEAERQWQRQWMARQWTAWQWIARGLGYGWHNGNAKVMDGLTATQRQWSDAMAMDGLMATAMKLGYGQHGNGQRNGLVMDGLTTM